MLFDILTLFPGFFSGVFDESIVWRAIEAGIITIRLHNIRDYAEGRHSMTDDAPYGGGGGMVMKPEPIFRAVEHVLSSQDQQTVEEAGSRIILLSPQGRPLTQQMACELSRQEHLMLICGRYEGVDERIREHLVTDEISIGDYVLSGGEIPAMVIVEAVTRLIPGVLGDPGATFEDSHMEGLLEYPHYTRPVEYRGWEVPKVLLSGDHARVVQWRRDQALRRTLERRPELLRKVKLSKRDMEFIDGSGLAAEGAYVSGITPDPHAFTDDKWWKEYQILETRNPGTYSVAGYAAMQVLSEGVKTAGTFEASRIADAIRSLRTSTTVGDIAYQNDGDLADQNIYIFKVENQDFIQVQPEP